MMRRQWGHVDVLTVVVVLLALVVILLLFGRPTWQ